MKSLLEQTVNVRGKGGAVDQRDGAALVERRVLRLA